VENFSASNMAKAMMSFIFISVRLLHTAQISKPNNVNAAYLLRSLSARYSLDSMPLAISRVFDLNQSIVGCHIFKTDCISNLFTKSATKFFCDTLCYRHSCHTPNHTILSNSQLMYDLFHHSRSSYVASKLKGREGLWSVLSFPP
jgi:hypothetical protein